MSLTAHFDARDTDNIFTTYGNPPSGTPGDGDAVQTWLAESGDLSLSYFAITSESPLWRQASPGLLLPCLDFDGSNDVLLALDDAGIVIRLSSDFITVSAFTVMIAFRVEGATDNNANAYDNHGLIATLNQFWGIHLRNSGSQVILQGYNWDGNADVVEINISVDTNYVLMFRHDSGNIYLSINGGSETSVASGNSSDLTGRLAVGENGDGTIGGGANNYNGRIGMIKIWNTANADGNQATELNTMITDWVTGAGGGGAVYRSGGPLVGEAVMGRRHLFDKRLIA